LAKKKKQTAPHRVPTRRQMASWQKQQRRQKIIFVTGVSIIALTIVIVLAGWLFGYFIPQRETVITVNDREFSYSYFVDALAARGAGRDAQQIQSTASILDSDIQQQELVRQEAEAMGITVSREEINAELEDLQLPRNDATRDIVAYNLTVGKLLDGYFDREVSATAEQVNVTAMLLEDEAAAGEVREKLAAGDNFTALAGEYSVNTYTRSRGGEIGWQPRERLVELLDTEAVADYAFGAPAGTLSQPRYDENVLKKVGYWLVKVLSGGGPAEEAEIQAMLLGSEGEAMEVREKLAGGDNFTALAQEHSQLTGTGIDFTEATPIRRGEVTGAFDAYVFGEEAPPEEVSLPVRDETVYTAGGYWLIQVLEKDENRELTENDRELLKEQALEEWIQTLFLDPANSIESNADKATIDRAVADVLNR
jgi:foldase protein PrsA